jgi:hypothetical protein
MQQQRIEAAAREARHDRWMKLAVLASITSAVCCAAMLTVTISLLRREPEANAGGAVRPAQESPAGTRRLLSDSESSSAASGPRFPALGTRFRPGAPDDGPAPDRGADFAARAGAATLVTGETLSPAVQELAKKFNLNPNALAPLAGADGEVPTAVVARLERSSDAGKGLARRLDLDETNTQTFSNLFLNQTIAVMALERRNGGPAEPEQLDALLQDTLAGVRVLAGEGAVSQAQELLGDLR